MAASPGANTLDTLNGLFKQVYASDIEDLIPDGVKLLVKIPFAKKDSALGGAYHQPVTLGLEHGVTFAAAGDDAFALEAPVSGQLKDATVQGTQLVLRSAIGYKSLSASSNGDKSAFKNATKYVVANMLRSVTKKLEIEMLYGQVGYATLAVNAVASNVITIPAAQWAPGIWGGAEKMPIEQRTSAGTLVKSMNVVSVDFENLQITVDGVAGTITAGDILWHKTAYGNEFAGLHKIISNTGTIFGIDASQYSLFRGNTYSAGSAALSFNKLQDAVSKAVEKGLDNDVMVIVNPLTWADLLSDESANRMYDQSYSPKKSENGSKEIMFHSQAGAMEVVSSIYCKRGFAYIISPDEMLRIGSSDVTFKLPGTNDQFFRHLDSHAGVEMRCYCDQALFAFNIAKNVIIENIVN